MIKCESCKTEFRLKEVVVKKSTNEQVLGMHLARSWCPNCNEQLKGVDPEAAEAEKPLVALTFVVVIALLGVMFLVPSETFGLVGLFVLVIAGAAFAYFGNLKHKLFGAVIVVLCLYLYATGQYIT